MPIAGRFTSIPTGTLTATMKGSELQAPFVMQAAFTSDTPSCAAGEYRQFVKGTFKVNGSVLRHVLCGSILLSADEYREDGCGPGKGCTAYGYRSCPQDPGLDEYLPQRATGCTFKGSDTPGLTGKRGDLLEMDLYFIGRLIDTKDNAPLAEATWRVYGSGKVMITILTSPSPVRNSKGEYLSVLAQPTDDEGLWQVDVLISRPPGGPPIDAGDVNVVVSGGSGQGLPVIARPTGRLAEAGGSRRVTASAQFKVQVNDDVPTTIEVLMQNENFSFNLTPQADQ